MYGKITIIPPAGVTITNNYTLFEGDINAIYTLASLSTPAILTKFIAEASNSKRFKSGHVATGKVVLQSGGKITSGTDISLYVFDKPTEFTTPALVPVV